MIGHGLVHMVNIMLVLPSNRSETRTRLALGGWYMICFIVRDRLFVGSDCIGIWENRAYGASMSMIVNSVGYSVTGCVTELV